MSFSQSQTGRAFEYAVVCAVKSVLGDSAVELQHNSCSQLALNDFSLFPPNKRASLILSAEAAIRKLLPFEPNLESALARASHLTMLMQPDRSGEFGDVRDVVISNPKTDWQIGISAKHQHEALKHSRLSPSIDFGHEWFDINCSNIYFDDIRPVFDYLKELKTKHALWSSVPRKDTDVYVPLLNAFKSELLRLDRSAPGMVAPKMVRYLIGTFDFYKLMKMQQQTKLQVYNFNGSLNRPCKKVQPSIRLERLRLPTRIIELDFKRNVQSGTSATTLDLVCDGGWQLSLRLHSASSKVEPSLKFDINLIGRPNNLQTFSIND